MSTSDSSKRTITRTISKILLFERPWFKKITKAIWILFATLVIGLPLYVVSVKVNLFGLFGGMPSLREIENPENDLSSEIISADGVSLGRYFRYNRSQVLYDDLSPDLVNTLLYSEDHRFREHSGVDLTAFGRVLKGILLVSHEGGGSTLTQQLAKNLFTQNAEFGLDGPLAKLGTTPRRIIQKTKEWIISVSMERNFTKEEIIAMYLNTAPFGHTTFGIKVASETYFNKKPDSLNIQESAVLVGLLQAPTVFDPKDNPTKALAKRNEVLNKLYKHQYIKTKAALDSIKNLPIELRYKLQNQNEGAATYFRTVIRQDLMKWCKEHGYDLWESGLRIYTTIDSRMQHYAEEAMREHMSTLQERFTNEWRLRNCDPWVDETGKTLTDFLERKIKRTTAYRSLVAKYGENNDSVTIMLNHKQPMTIFSWKGERDTLFSSIDSLNYYNRFLQSGMMSMDAETGAIKAWVGGIDHKFFKFDHVRMAKRQPGSTFKPFVYGAAIEAGYDPCFELYDISPTIKISGKTWTPKNASPPYGGSGEKLTLRQGMARSLNSISAQVINLVKPEAVVEFAHRMGIGSDLAPVPSLCLGTSDVNLYELVSAYCPFVNLGIHTSPYYITRIEDRNGNIIESFIPKTRQSIDEKTAYKMVYMLRGGVEEKDGTSAGISDTLKNGNARGLGGKTGTTDNASDGWYIGVTRNLVSGIWVGGDERSIHFPSWNLGSGSRSARPIWEKFMIKIYEHPEIGYTKEPFKEPTVNGFQIDCPEDHEKDPNNYDPNQL